MKNGITPGEWTLLPDPEGWTLHSNGQDIMASPFDCTDADAHLISASPTLLEACKAALAGTPHARLMLEAAIAKAEGGT